MNTLENRILFTLWKALKKISKEPVFSQKVSNYRQTLPIIFGELSHFLTSKMNSEKNLNIYCIIYEVKRIHK